MSDRASTGRADGGVDPGLFILLPGTSTNPAGTLWISERGRSRGPTDRRDGRCLLCDSMAALAILLQTKASCVRAGITRMREVSALPKAVVFDLDGALHHKASVQ